jgi:hypothetical protein
VARVLPADRSRDGIKGGLGDPTHGRLDPWRFTDCDKSIGVIFGLADLSSQSERDDVSTFRKAQKYSRETPKQSSTLSPPNSATRVMSWLRAGQTFQQATQVQTLRLCPNQGWPRCKPHKLANIRQNPAFAQLSMQWVAAESARSQLALLGTTSPRSTLTARSTFSSNASRPAKTKSRTGCRRPQAVRSR